MKRITVWTVIASHEGQTFRFPFEERHDADAFMESMKREFELEWIYCR